MSEQRLGNGATYRLLTEIENVFVRVPKLSAAMRLLPGGHPILSVPEHWAHGKPFERRDKRLFEAAIILNCNFFGIEERDLGRRIVAKVKAIHKVTTSGETYLMLDITKTSGEATCEMKFYPTADESRTLFPGSYISILGSNSVITFAPLPVRVPMDEKKTAVA